MKILLLNPRDLTYKTGQGAFARSVSYPALTLTRLAALVPPELGAAVAILDEGVDDQPVDFAVDVLAISVVTATSRRAYAIADEARARGVHVVLGGFHVTWNADEAALHGDTVILGQADDTWPRFLRDFVRGEPHARYDQDGVPDLANRAWPRRDLLKKGAYMRNVVSIEATRGCPNRCGFCVVSQHAGHRLITRPVHDVIDEMRSTDARAFVFLDPNFHADRAYAHELMAAMVDLKIRWACLSTVDVGLDDQTLDLMRRSGCLGALVGFESVCPASLIETGKGHNRIATYLDAVRGFKEHRVSVLGCFIFGFDGDTREVFDETVDFVCKSRMELARYAVLTPFPGTALYRELDAQGRIIEKNPDLYDFQHVVLRPKGMTPKELQQGLVHAWKSTYRLRNVMRRVMQASGNRLLVAAANAGFLRYHKALLRLYAEHGTPTSEA